MRLILKGCLEISRGCKSPVIGYKAVSSPGRGVVNQSHYVIDTLEPALSSRFWNEKWRGELCEPLFPSNVSSLGVAELRPPFLLGRAISFENSLLPAQQRKWQGDFHD